MLPRLRQPAQKGWVGHEFRKSLGETCDFISQMVSRTTGSSERYWRHTPFNVISEFNINGGGGGNIGCDAYACALVGRLPYRRGGAARGLRGTSRASVLGRRSMLPHPPCSASNTPLKFWVQVFEVMVLKGQDFGLNVWGSGFRVQSSGFRIQDSGFLVPGTRFRAQGSEFRVPGSWFLVPGSGLRVPGTRFRVGSMFQIRIPPQVKNGERDPVCKYSTHYASTCTHNVVTLGGTCVDPLPKPQLIPSCAPKLTRAHVDPRPKPPRVPDESSPHRPKHHTA